MGNEGFTGVEPWQRSAYFGGPSAGEVINYDNNPISAVDGWMETLYHRLLLIDSGITEMGYGEGGGNVINMTWGKASDTEVAYPYPGQTDVPVGWDGREWPDPRRFHPTAPEGPWGYTITLTFGGRPRKLTLEQAQLTDSQGTSVELMKFDPKLDNYLTTSVSVIPYKPLKPDTTYTVRLAGKADFGKGVTGWERSWSFRTAPAEAGGDARATWRMTRSYLHGGGWHTQYSENFPAGMQVFANGVPVEGLQVQSGELTFRLPAHLSGSWGNLLFVDPEGHEAWTTRVGRTEPSSNAPPFQPDTVSLRLRGQVVRPSAQVYAPTGGVMLFQDELARLGATPTARRAARCGPAAPSPR